MRYLKDKYAWKDERGGAAVEFTISMLVIVPVFMYGLLLQDILMGRLDQQESVAGAAWDFTTHYTESAWQVGSYNRLTWCNHTSMFDSFGWSYDCSAEDHHAELGAHICWLVAGGRQVQCRHNKNFARFSLDTTHERFHDEYNQGGLFTCDARLGVLNRLVPVDFLTQWSQEEFAPIEKHELGTRVETGAGGEVECDPDDDECESVHATAQSAGEGGKLTIRESRFAVMADTWNLFPHGSMDYISDYAPGERSGDLYERVNFLYRNNVAWPFAAISAIQFFLGAYNEELINPLYPMIMGDNPMFPNISKRTGDDTTPPPAARIRQPSGNRNYHVTPWETNDGETRYKDTWEARGKYYMGATDSPSR